MDFIVDLPLSKSVWNRWLVLKALYPLAVDLRNWPHPIPGVAPDDVLALSTLVGALGKEKKVDVGLAGTAWRFGLSALAVVPETEVEVHGDVRLNDRPIVDLVNALRDLGADIMGEYPPHKVRGKKLNGGTVAISAGTSSQFLSGLLMIGPSTVQGLHIVFRGPLVSEPYVQMTLEMMRSIGLQIDRRTDGYFVHPQSAGKAFAPPVEKDWSAASVWAAAVAITGKPVLFQGLSWVSEQGDAIGPALWEKLGVEVQCTSEGVRAFPSEKKMPIAQWNHDFSQTPDIVQPLAVAAIATGMSIDFRGLQTLPGKESHRLHTLAEALHLLGATTTLSSDRLQAVSGTLPTHRPGQCFSHHDHRHAFALALVDCVRPLQITSPECVSKSYPNFWSQWAAYRKLSVSDPWV